jgi:capsule polysaccharide export protein KpsE/RkpR
MRHDELPNAARNEEGYGVDLFDFLYPLARHLKLLIVGPLVAGAVALTLTYRSPPIFTARTVFVSPQPQQGAAAAALASLGALSSLASGMSGGKNLADQYVSLLRSNTVVDRLIDEFRLMQVYESKLRMEARREFASNVHIAVGKTDGLITVEVSDQSPERAAQIANRHIDELRRLTAQLALTEAQQRRAFFEAQLATTKDRLARAQEALQASGIGQGTLKAEPRAAAESYARLRAEATATEIRLHTLRRSFSDTAPEVQQHASTLAALRSQLARVEATTEVGDGPDYIGKYREFKYQETLFDLFAKQYEMARLDESREGGAIQVVDAALPPEQKSRPRRRLAAVVTSLATFALLFTFVLLRHFWRKSAAQPETAAKIALIRRAVMGKGVLPPER